MSRHDIWLWTTRWSHFPYFKSNNAPLCQISAFLALRQVTTCIPLSTTSDIRETPHGPVFPCSLQYVNNKCFYLEWKPLLWNSLEILWKIKMNCSYFSSRRSFCQSRPFEDWIQSYMGGLKLSTCGIQIGSWIHTMRSMQQLRPWYAHECICILNVIINVKLS